MNLSHLSVEQLETLHEIFLLIKKAKARRLPTYHQVQVRGAKQTHGHPLIRDVVQYEGLYMVTKYGNVYSLITNKWLKGTANFGYQYTGVALTKNNKTKVWGLHKIVALAWCDNPNNYPYVLHKDDNKANNHADNLYWGNNSQNRKDYHANKVKNP